MSKTVTFIQNQYKTKTVNIPSWEQDSNLWERQDSSSNRTDIQYLSANTLKMLILMSTEPAGVQACSLGLGIRLGLVLGIELVSGLVMVYRLAHF